MQRHEASTLLITSIHTSPDHNNPTESNLYDFDTLAIHLVNRSALFLTDMY